MKGAEKTAAYRPWWMIAVVMLVCGCGSTLVGDDPQDDPESLFEQFWTSYDRYYAHFELKEVNWNEVYEKYRRQVGPETTEDELFEVFSDMISELEDGHVYLVGNGRRALSNGHLRASRRTFDADIVAGQYMLENPTGLAEGRIVYGRLGSEIGYIRLSTLSSGEDLDTGAGWIEQFDKAIEEFDSAQGLVLDLRNNGGGRASNTEYVASHFATERRPFLVTRSRNGPEHDDFTTPRRWYVEPNGERVFAAPVVVLTNRRTFSAAEWLTLALRQFDHVVHMGSHTGGGLAMFLPRQLSNGWMYTVSVQDTRCPQGRSYERVGVAPHRYVSVDRDDLDDGRDVMLEEAMQWLSHSRAEEQ